MALTVGGARESLTPYVDVDHVGVQIGEAHLIKDVTFTVSKGAIVGIVGPNGAGKTTLMRVMTGLRPPSRGEVRLEGQPVHRLRTRHRARHIAFVRQQAHIGFGFTVRDVVKMGRYAYLGPGLFRTDTGTVVDEAMARTSIDHLHRRPLTQLSGGEKQRVFIARALAQQPSLLFLDEPTSHLDVRHELELLAFVRDLNRRDGLTVVMALHDLQKAATFCDDLIVLKDGTLAAAGPPERVLTETLLRDVFGVRAFIEPGDGVSRPWRIEYAVPEAPMAAPR